MKIKTQVKAGALFANHNQTTASVKIKTQLNAGGWNNHNQSTAGMKIKTQVKAGGWGNHNQTTAGVKIRSSVKAGGIIMPGNR